jgi:phage protein D
MPHAILAKVNDSPARAGVSEIVAKLRKAIRIEIPIGYQDERGFHMGAKPAEKQAKSHWFCKE